MKKKGKVEFRFINNVDFSIFFVIEIWHLQKILNEFFEGMSVDDFIYNFAQNPYVLQIYNVSKERKYILYEAKEYLDDLGNVIKKVGVYR